MELALTRLNVSDRKREYFTRIDGHHKRPLALWHFQPFVICRVCAEICYRSKLTGQARIATSWTQLATCALEQGDWAEAEKLAGDAAHYFDDAKSVNSG